MLHAAVAAVEFRQSRYAIDTQAMQAVSFRTTVAKEGAER